jgi:hypothetical protein
MGVSSTVSAELPNCMGRRGQRTRSTFGGIRARVAGTELAAAQLGALSRST